MSLSIFPNRMLSAIIGIFSALSIRKRHRTSSGDTPEQDPQHQSSALCTYCVITRYIPSILSRKISKIEKWGVAADRIGQPNLS